MLNAAGQPDAIHYPLWYLSYQSRLYAQTENARHVTQALIIEQAVSASQGGRKRFNRFRKFLEVFK